MAKIERVTGKIFGENATATGLDPQIGQFGSALAGTYVGTTDISTIQQLPAWGQGFIGAVTTANQFPALPEMTGFGKVLSYQQNYLLQQGIAEWDSGTTYYDGSFCSLNRKLYVSITDDNLNNNPENDTVNWQEFSSGGAGLEIGDIGIAVLGIDETLGKRRYLNGQVIIQEQYQVFTNKVKSAIVLYPNLACSEQDWQATATLSAFGQCGKFVVDDVAGTIRLPKITGFIQGLNDLASLGSLVEAGLPNIEGTVLETGNQWQSADGAFELNSTGTTYTHTDAYTSPQGFNFDASRSSSIYGNSNTVQPESIRYPYFIQIATGSDVEVDIINEIELNNPYTLFDSKYTEAELFNASWLRSNGQYNSGSIYVSAYQALLIENNTDIEVGTTVNNYTKRGLSVKLSTETYTDYDFVLNTSDETFRLPIKTNLADDNNENLLLYFYIGETVQNANLINAGRIEEKVANLIPDNSNLISSYCTPDYENGIICTASLGVEQTYTAPSNGMITYSLSAYNNGQAYIKINNQQVQWAKAYQNPDFNSITGSLLVSKNDVIKYFSHYTTTLYNTQNIIFYPMKGAN